MSKFANPGAFRIGLDRYAKSLREWQARVLKPLSDRDGLAFLHRDQLDSALLGEIEQALERAREGTFGQCLECGDRIPARRLDAAPWTKFCRRCQDVLNVMASHTRGGA